MNKMGFMGFKGALLGALYCVLRSWQTMLYRDSTWEDFGTTKQ